MWGLWTRVRSGKTVLGETLSVKFFFPLLQWITTDKTKKLLFRPGSKVFLVVLSGCYFPICRNCVLINKRGCQVERALLPFASFLGTCLLTELKQPKLLHDNDTGVITPAVCMWARNGWRALFCCSYCLVSLRAKCSWGEAESDLKHILLTVFPPADETWLKVKTQLLNTIYGQSRFHQSHFVECFQLVSSRWPLHHSSRDVGWNFGLLSMGLVQPCELGCLVSFWICVLLCIAKKGLEMLFMQSKQRCIGEVWRIRCLKYLLFNFEYGSVYKEKMETVKWWSKETFLKFRLFWFRVSSGFFWNFWY